MNMIVAVDDNWGIGKNNGLLASVPGDMAFFKYKTMDHVVVMGRKTLESLPQKQPLANRTNIVLSENPKFKIKGAIVVHSMDELMEELKKYDDDDIYIVGGESVYRQLLPYCNTAHVTKIDYTYEAYAHFPNLDELQEWHITADSEEQTYFDLEYVFLKYERK